MSWIIAFSIFLLHALGVILFLAAVCVLVAGLNAVLGKSVMDKILIFIGICAVLFGVTIIVSDIHSDIVKKSSLEKVK